MSPLNGVDVKISSCGMGKANILLMEEIRLYNQLRLVVYPTVYRVLYIPGGAGFLPSIVLLFTKPPKWTMNTWNFVALPESIGKKIDNCYENH